MTTPRYFIVNKAGAVHEVTRENAVEQLKKPGFRMATKDEVQKYLAQRIQRADRPIAEPFKPEPEPEAIEPEAVPVEVGDNADGKKAAAKKAAAKKADNKADGKSEEKNEDTKK